MISHITQPPPKMRLLLLFDALPYAATLSFIAWIVDAFTGLEAPAYFAFCTVFLTDWLTGLYAAKFRNEKIVSKKLGQKAIDIAIWTILLTVLNTLDSALPWALNIQGLDVRLGILRAIWWVVITTSVLTEFYSICENMKDSGSGSAARVLSVLDKLFTGPARLIWDAVHRKERTSASTSLSKEEPHDPAQ